MRILNARNLPWFIFVSLATIAAVFCTPAIFIQPKARRGFGCRRCCCKGRRSRSRNPRGSSAVSSRTITRNLKRTFFSRASRRQTSSPIWSKCFCSNIRAGAREDTVLFPTFRGIVSAHEFDSLGEDFEKKEDELFGDDGFEKMVDKVAQIEKNLGIYELAQFTPKM